MLQSEFEKLTGYKVEPETYKVIESIYMTCSLEKDAFCKEWLRVKDSQILRDLALECDNLKQVNQSNVKQISEEGQFLADMVATCKDLVVREELRTRAINLIGSKEYIKYILAKGYELTELDRECIFNLIDKH